MYVCGASIFSRLNQKRPNEDDNITDDIIPQAPATALTVQVLHGTQTVGIAAIVAVLKRIELYRAED